MILASTCSDWSSLATSTLGFYLAFSIKLPLSNSPTCHILSPMGTVSLDHISPAHNPLTALVRPAVHFLKDLTPTVWTFVTYLSPYTPQSLWPPFLPYPRSHSRLDGAYCNFDCWLNAKAIGILLAMLPGHSYCGIISY